jgi:hypothetical protein
MYRINVVINVKIINKLIYNLSKKKKKKKSNKCQKNCFLRFATTFDIYLQYYHGCIIATARYCDDIKCDIY